jgi:hypothetical protein
VDDAMQFPAMLFQFLVHAADEPVDAREPFGMLHGTGLKGVDAAEGFVQGEAHGNLGVETGIPETGMEGYVLRNPHLAVDVVDEAVETGVGLRDVAVEAGVQIVQGPGNVHRIPRTGLGLLVDPHFPVDVDSLLVIVHGIRITVLVPVVERYFGDGIVILVSHPSSVKRWI